MPPHDLLAANGAIQNAIYVRDTLATAGDIRVEKASGMALVGILDALTAIAILLENAQEGGGALRVVAETIAVER